jgi:AsmA family protein
VRLSARGGSLGRTEAQVLGGDLRGAFAGLLTHDRAATPLLCLQADFDALNGQAWARRLVFATPAGVVTGRGSVDLGAETVDLVLTGAPARRGLSAPDGFVSLQGPLAHPRVALHAGGVLGVLRSLLSLAPAPGPAPAPRC